VLWFFHKFIQPYIAKIWNPWKKVEASQDGGGDTKDPSKMKCPFKSDSSTQNGEVTGTVIGHPEVLSSGDKKRD